MSRMPIPTLRKTLAAGALALGLLLQAVLPSTASAHAAPRLWSIAAHFRYVDGFEFDYIFATGEPTADLGDALAMCGQSHAYGAGAVVSYHCYPIPE